MIPQALLFLHIAAALGFFGAHGVSVGVALSLRGDASPERLRALLELSDASRGGSNVGLMLLLASGVALGFLSHAWASGWIWSSLALFVAVSVAMSLFMTPSFNALRRAAGSPYRQGGKVRAALPPAPAEIAAVVRAMPARTVSAGSLLLSVGILYLMVFKPF